MEPDRKAPLTEVKSQPLRDTRLGSIVESAMDAIITVDESQRVVLFNRAAEQVFGRSREEALGAPLDEFIPARFRAGHRELVRRFGEGDGQSRRMGAHARVVQGLRRDGREFPIDASISQVVEGGQHYYTVIVRDVTQRVEQEDALRRSRDQIEVFSHAANTAREQEKSRIARELHDELGQSLMALKIDLGWLRENIPAASPELTRKLAAMQVLVDGTVAAARRISGDLRPLMLDDLGLTAAAEWLAHQFTTRTGIPCEFVLGEGQLDLPDPYATTIFRVLQESLTNVAKHADAKQVEVTLEREGDLVLLTVSDDGRGFVTGEPHPGSYGLIGQRERAFLVQGEVRVDSEPGKGTRVELRVPVPK
jgi:PAS domain S-box-containing protein